MIKVNADTHTGTVSCNTHFPITVVPRAHILPPVTVFSQMLDEVPDAMRAPAPSISRDSTYSSIDTGGEY
jgi:hypothetical protein